METETHIHNKHVEFVPKADIKKNRKRLNNGDGRKDLKAPVKNMVKNCVEIENDSKHESKLEETLDEKEYVPGRSDSDQSSLTFKESKKSSNCENLIQFYLTVI